MTQSSLPTPSPTPPLHPSTPKPTTSTTSTTSTTTPSIRLASPSDAPQIAALGATVFATTFGYSLPPDDLSAYLSSSYSPAAIASDLQNTAMTTFVACSPSAPETVLGFAQLTRGTSEPCLEGQPRPVELQRLYVSTAAHGMGLGRKLFEAAEGRAREEGYETFWLGVWEENVAAQGFYRKVGLEKCGEHGFTMGSCVQVDWIMKKSLV